MESVKYIGLDVHQSTISVAVRNGEGKLLMQPVIATKATAVLDWLKGLRGVLHVTFEFYRTCRVAIAPQTRK
jgi:hypothetical protein